MKKLFYIILLFSFSVFAQESITAEFIEKTPFKADSIIDIDNFKTIYFLKNNALIRLRDKKTINYSNIQLGNITSINAFNPLKINVFYKAFNAVIVLDNRLAEVFKIDFNQLKEYKNVTHISTGYDNTIWVFNQDLQQLELFDYKLNKTRAKTLPVQSEVLDITSNYNSCWLLTRNFLYQYNYVGSLIQKIENTGYTKINESDENIFLKKENALFLLPKNSKVVLPIKISNLLINQFFVTNQNLYIYSDETLHQYQLKIK